MIQQSPETGALFAGRECAECGGAPVHYLTCSKSEPRYRGAGPWPGGEFYVWDNIEGGIHVERTGDWAFRSLSAANKAADRLNHPPVDAPPPDSRDAGDRFLDWVRGAWRNGRSSLKGWIRNPVFSVLDLWLGITVGLWLLGPQGQARLLAIAPVVAIWAAARLWARRP